MVSSTSYNWIRFSLNRTKKDDDDHDRTPKVQIHISNTITDTYTVDSQRIV